ncbi:hypothetical protein DPMN_154379 [Dreissena polymorpha]|uniref:Uncharacterized protein n=1 Tax=Dreissena polymorpha TaxID=45954 RepID=A0A9D4FKW5_DREPO|nr:hypothetical protein DPMN_154379 [Dreissena polymorpha]
MMSLSNCTCPSSRTVCNSVDGLTDSLNLAWSSLGLLTLSNCSCPPSGAFCTSVA